MRSPVVLLLALLGFSAAAAQVHPETRVPGPDTLVRRLVAEELASRFDAGSGAPYGPGAVVVWRGPAHPEVEIVRASLPISHMRPLTIGFVAGRGFRLGGFSHPELREVHSALGELPQDSAARVRRARLLAELVSPVGADETLPDAGTSVVGYVVQREADPVFGAPAWTPRIRSFPGGTVVEFSLVARDPHEMGRPWIVLPFRFVFSTRGELVSWSQEAEQRIRPLAHVWAVAEAHASGAGRDDGGTVETLVRMQLMAEDLERQPRQVGSAPVALPPDGRTERACGCPVLWGHDAWGTRIEHAVSADGFLLRSAGPDRVFRTGDDLLLSFTGTETTRF